MDLHDMLARGGSLGERIAGHAWGDTLLGPLDAWPQSLRTALGICLQSPFPMSIWWGPEFVLLYNDAYVPVLGKKHPRALGEPGLGPAAWAEIADDLEPLLRRVVAGGQVPWMKDELLIMERYGYPDECYFTYSYSAIHDESGGVAGALNVCIETTERVVGDRRLRTLRELAATSVVEAASVEDACAGSMAVLRANDADLSFVLLYLAAPEGGPPVARSAPSGEQARLATLAWPCEEVLTTGEARVIADAEARFGPLPGGCWPEGTRAVALLPVSTGGERPDGVLVAGVSPRRELDAAYRGFLDLVAGQVSAALTKARAYEEARGRAEALAALDRAKTAFFSNVSHEFRTPLTLILGPLSDARASGALTGPDLDIAHTNAVRLLRLTNNLLDFARAEAGRVEATFQRTDLAAYTADLASSFRSLFETAGLALRVEAAPLDADVWLDRRLWERVVLNLLSNAFKHTFDGGVTVTARLDGAAAVVEVADTGVGIAPDDLARIFDRFQRVHGARSRTHEGAGIGLALVKELVGLHGGAVEVTSAVGVGSTFRVRLPLGRAHLPAERVREGGAELPTVDAAPYVEEAAAWLPRDARLHPDEHPTAPDATPRPRVLLADDNADMRAYVARLLAPHWDVVPVADGRRALDEARRAPPDLVLSDVMMPGLDGFELLRALRAEPATRLVPIVLLSARAGEEARVGGLDAGADDYLVKPFSADELLARVRSQLELGALRRAREREVERANVALEAKVAERTRELTEKAAALEEANRELTAFTYSIAHDLRGPLRSLDRYADALRTDYADRPLDPTGQLYAERIGIAARRMDALITGLLDYSRITRAPARDLVDVARIARDVVPAGADVTVVDPLPPVVGDPMLLGQVLANLLSNAVKFVAPGVAPHVRLRGERVDGDRVRIWVEDDGIGIAPEYQERVFKVFERLHGIGAYPGTGIGLAIVHRAVERMGGRVGVESEPGVGSRFWFELPGG